MSICPYLKDPADASIIATSTVLSHITGVDSSFTCLPGYLANIKRLSARHVFLNVQKCQGIDV